MLRKKINFLKEDKIHEDEIEWLVSFYYAFINDETSIAEEEAKEAYKKLIEYGLTDKQIEDIFDKTKTEEFPQKAFDKAWAKQLERNEFEKYTLFEMIKIFLFGPYNLFKFFDSGLIELWKDNYKTKFRQRLVLLILGIVFWILLLVGTYKYYEYKWIQKIESTDISNL